MLQLGKECGVEIQSTNLCLGNQLTVGIAENFLISATGSIIRPICKNFPYSLTVFHLINGYGRQIVISGNKPIYAVRNIRATMDQYKRFMILIEEIDFPSLALC